MSAKKKNWLSVPEVAEICEVAITTVHAWIKSGLLQSRQLSGPGGHHRIRKSDLDEFLKASEPKSGTRARS